MKGTRESDKLWKCPTCGRQFERHNQSHSCKVYPLELHFLRKDTGRALYERLCKEMHKKVGRFKIESLECCIHFVSTFTFAAVKIFKDKIRIDISLSYPIKNLRIKQAVKVSSNRFLYFIDIKSEAEINDELINWIKEARDKK